MSPFHTIRLGTCNTYLIPGNKGFILIDAGNRNKGATFKRRLKSLSITPGDIRLIVITHVHFDHVGSCLAIKSLTQAKVMVHQAERDLLEKGVVVIPPGITPFHRIAGVLGNRYFKHFFQFPAVPVDIGTLYKTSLEDFGIDGIVIPTPGHTRGSLSVLLKSGEAFVGDLAVNYFPLGIGGYLPPYGENIPQILSGWETLLKAGAKIIYPGHGFPISAARLITALKKHKKRLHG